MHARTLVIGCLILAVVLAASNLNTATAANTPQQSATLSFTLTTTSSYIVTTGGHLTVKFNSVQVDTSSPQAYAFGITATAAPGATITRLHWEFGDGTFLDVPYCCENQVSEVRYHAYQQPGTYTVLIIAYDSAGNFGDAFVTVSWPTPIPEFTAFIGPVLISIIMGLATVGFLKSRRIQFLVK